MIYLLQAHASYNMRLLKVNFNFIERHALDESQDSISNNGNHNNNSVEPRGLEIYLPSLKFKKRLLLINYACNFAIFGIKLLSILLSTNIKGLEYNNFIKPNVFKCWMFEI